MSDVAGVEGLAYEPVNPANSTTCAEGAADKDHIEAKGVSGASAAPWPEWQPIETAPKDGTPFLAVVGAKMAVIFWAHDAWDFPLGFVMFDHTDDEPPPPSHWVHLPALPASPEPKP